MSIDAATRARVETSLIRKHWSDEGFRAELLADPTAVYAAEVDALGSGGGLPAGVAVEIVEESGDQIFLVLPLAPAIVPGDDVTLTERSSRAELEGVLVRRAWRDGAYRRRLLADPRSAYDEQLRSVGRGATLPDSLRVEVREETPTTIVLRIPTPPAPGTELLGEEELEQVAGGVVSANVFITTYVTVGLVACVAILNQN